MISEDTYKAYCNRLMAYISNNMTYSKLVLTKHSDFYAVFLCYKDPDQPESSLMLEALTYKEMCFKLLTFSQCRPLTKESSIEEIELQLQIRGY